MKFLKLYEDYDNIMNYGLNQFPMKDPPKFEKGQTVKIFTKVDPINGWKSEPYKIKDIRIEFSYENGKNNYYYKLITDYSKAEEYIWRNEDTLMLVPDYELEADKYNL